MKKLVAVWEEDGFVYEQKVELWNGGSPGEPGQTYYVVEKRKRKCKTIVQILEDWLRGKE